MLNERFRRWKNNEKKKRKFWVSAQTLPSNLEELSASWFLYLSWVIAGIKEDSTHETPHVVKCCAVLTVTVIATEFKQYFWGAPSMPSSVLIGVARTDDLTPGSNSNILQEPDLEKRRHRCGRNTAQRCQQQPPLGILGKPVDGDGWGRYMGVNLKS